MQQRIYADQTRGRHQFERAYEGKLRRWLDEDLKGATEAELPTVLRKLIVTSFDENRDVLRRQFPELSDDSLLAAHVVQLVHGHYEFATQTTECSGPGELLDLPHADCSELADACALLLSLFDKSAQLVSFGVDYDTELGHFRASHAVVAAGGMILDPTINMIITKSIKEILELPKATRFEDLLESDDLHLGYNRYLEPKRRRIQIEQHNTDAGVLAFYYPWYLEGLSAPRSTITYRQIATSRRFVQSTQEGAGRSLHR